MGCDIHGTVEVRTGDGKWVMINELGWEATLRNYQRFAELAGVRGEGTRGLQPKGLPQNISESTAYHVDGWGVDGHSHSHMELDEALKIWVETEYNDFQDDPDQRKKGAWFESSPEYYFFGIDRYTRDKEYRVVFWFDC